jgi:hypothetical protein
MFPLIISLISFASSQDVSVEVYLPQSQNTDTEVYISTPDEDIRISYESTDISEYGYYSGTARVNSDEGSSKSDELTVTVVNSWGEDSTYNSVSVTNQGGDSVTFEAGASSKADNKTGTVNSTEHVSVSSYDASTGTTQTDKVEVNSTVASNGTDVVYVTTVEANVGNTSYQEVEVGYVDQNGSGASVSVFEFSETSQVNSSSGSWMTFAVLALLAGLLVLAYKRWAGESVKTYQMVTRPVEADYIRI